MGVAEGSKAVEEEREVSKREGGGDIINAGHDGGSKGAEAIITRGREKVGIGTAFELIKEGGEDLVEDEAAKQEGAEGATLGKTFRLGKWDQVQSELMNQQVLEVW